MNVLGKLDRVSFALLPSLASLPRVIANMFLGTSVGKGERYGISSFSHREQKICARSKSRFSAFSASVVNGCRILARTERATSRKRDRSVGIPKPSISYNESKVQRCNRQRTSCKDEGHDW